MREGLRSGKVIPKGKNGKVSKKSVISKPTQLRTRNGRFAPSGVEKALNFVSVGLVSEGESSCLNERSVGGKVLRERVGLKDDARKRKNVDGVGVENKGGVSRKKVKEEPIVDQVHVSRRVLRSSTVGYGFSVKVEDRKVLGKSSGGNKFIVEEDEKSDSDQSEKMVDVEGEEESNSDKSEKIVNMEGEENCNGDKLEKMVDVEGEEKCDGDKSEKKIDMEREEKCDRDMLEKMVDVAGEEKCDCVKSEKKVDVEGEEKCDGDRLEKMVDAEGEEKCDGDKSEKMVDVEREEKCNGDKLEKMVDVDGEEKCDSDKSEKKVDVEGEEMCDGDKLEKKVDVEGEEKCDGDKSEKKVDVVREENCGGDKSEKMLDAEREEKRDGDKSEMKIDVEREEKCDGDKLENTIDVEREGKCDGDKLEKAMDVEREEKCDSHRSEKTIYVGGEEKCDGDKSEKKIDVVREEKCDPFVGGVGMEVKRKRGRPPLVRNTGTGESVPKILKVAVKRPGIEIKEEHSMIQLDGGPKKKRKDGRGRPRKVLENSGVVRPMQGKSVKVPDIGIKEGHRLIELDGGPRKKRKDGRGRPRKVPENSGVMKPMQGKPVKVPEHNRVLQRKQGQPPMVKPGNAALRVKLGRLCKMKKKEFTPVVFDGKLKKKFKDRRGRPAKLKESSEFSLEGKMRSLELQDNTKADFDTRENKDSSGKTSMAVTTASFDTEVGSNPKKGKVEPGRSLLKQSVREKIIEILLSAGWTIQHRPRFNKDYLDSVYVNLHGQTHWSVTLAYNKLKQHYEKGSGDATYYKAGFQFIPIPDDELEILKKVIVNRRVGKKNKHGKCVTSVDGVTSKKNQKKKLVGKSMKGKTKGKNLLRKQENSASMQHKRVLVSSRDHDRKKLQNGKRHTLLVRKSMEEADSDTDGYIPYVGKRTVLGWMIDLGTVLLDGKVQYMDQKMTQVLLEGRLTRDGIHCGCCNQTLTISEFETHAGSKITVKEPLKNIRLESGTALLQCLLESWNKQPESERKGFHQIDMNGEDPNDDTCGICGDGGDLVCCDGCPSTFHQSCLEIQKFPLGDWHCVYCLCKFCGKAGRNEIQGDDNDNLDAPPELLSCQLCEDTYHQLCSKEKDARHELSFCEKKCSELFENLKKLLGVKHILEEGFSCTLVWRSDVNSSTCACDEPQKWDVAQKIESNSKLAVALSVMDECFLPMLDNRSGINLIRNIVYNFGSNFKRLNYSGFFTAILERGDEIISAASIRIHGNYLAEMPFIGTRYMYRRQGMCRRLLSAIESVLCSLGVERLVIPAISQLEETWTSVFGFRPVEVSSKEKMKNMNLLVFPGVQMLEKPTSKPQTVEGPKSLELEEEVFEIDKVCIKDSISNKSDVAAEHCGDKINEPTVESSLQLPDGALESTDAKYLVELGTSPDNLEGKNEILIAGGSICGFQEQAEEVSGCPSVRSTSITPVIDLNPAGLGSQSSEHIVSEEEDRSSVLPCLVSGAPECGELALCAYSENTKNSNCEIKGVDHTVKDILNCCEVSSVLHPTEARNSQPREKNISHEFEVSMERASCSDSVSRKQMPNSDHSNHLGENIPTSHELLSNCPAAVQTALTLGGIYSTSSKCYKDSADLEDNSWDCRLLLDSSFTSSHENGHKTDESLVSAVDSNCDPTCGDYLETNGHCKSKEVVSGSLGFIVDSIKD